MELSFDCHQHGIQLLLAKWFRKTTETIYFYCSTFLNINPTKPSWDLLPQGPLGASSLFSNSGSNFAASTLMCVVVFKYVYIYICAPSQNQPNKEIISQNFTPPKMNNIHNQSSRGTFGAPHLFCSLWTISTSLSLIGSTTGYQY